jgi:GcrA cell cycle regulator
MGARGKPQIKWTEEKKSVVRKMHAEGRTATEMAERIGEDVSRAAVLGLMSRMGLKQISKETRTRGGYTRQSYYIKGKSYFQFGRGFAPDFKHKPVPGIRDVLTLADDPVEAERVSLLDLKNHHCRFPFGEPSAVRFCGRTKRAGSAYCDAHHERCNVEPRKW